ncbi:MAG: GEVED domain-containing protein, partial [Bacteroidota bacterium]
MLKTPIPNASSEQYFQEVRRLSNRLRIYLLSVDPRHVEEDQALAYLQEHRDVDIAQFNHYVKSRKALTTFPNDPSFGDQWDMNNTGQNGGLVDADIDAPEAWDINTGGLTAFGDTVVVAVIDGGLDVSHPDLNVWRNHAEIPNNNIDDDNNGYVDDYFGWNAYGSNGTVPNDGHGTHVGGTVSARGDNNLGVSGVNWGVKVMGIAGSSGQEAIVIEAYGYALEMRARYNQSNGAEGAFVVATNSSFGVDFGDPANFPLWCAFYDSLGAEGILSAGATMNNGSDVDATNDVPTACSSPWLITVTNSTRQDVRNGGAAYGITTIDLAAPGTQILSTLPNGTYGNNTGTSMATPHVAGAIGLLVSAACPGLLAQYQLDPAGTALLFRDILFQGVDTLPQFVNELVTGGRLNLYNTLLQLEQTCLQFGDCPAVIDASLVGAITDTAVSLNWTNIDSALQYEIQFRELGDSLWINAGTTALDSGFLAGLKACTDYEVQVQSICPNDSSGFFQTLEFRTEGCCEAPLNLVGGGAQDSSLELFWAPVYGATGYTVQYRPLGDSLWLETVVSDTSGWVNELIPCRAYEVQVQTNCEGEKNEFSPSTILYTTGCESCVDAAYCDMDLVSSVVGYIDSVELGPLVSGTGNNSGYGSFIQAATVFEARDSFDVRIVPDLSLTNSSYKLRIWADLNGDGDFDDADETLFDAGPSNGIITGQAWMPEPAQAGIVRLRVGMRLVSNPNDDPPTPCGVYPFGEVEDYCVQLRVPCDAPDSLQIIKRYDDSGLIDVSWIGENQADSYEVNLMNLNDSSLTYFTTDSTGIVLGPFGSCTPYAISVYSVCGMDTSSSTTKGTFTSLGCGACIDPDYCPQKGVNQNAWIAGISLDSWNNSSGNDAGYGDFTGQGPTLPRGDQVSLELIPGFAGISDSVSWRVWADWNQDGDFDDAGELAYEPGQAALDTLFDNFVIPSNAALGATRLRVSAQVGTTSDACGTILIGETEDYCLNISPATNIEQPNDFDVKVYPNPGPGKFTLESDLPVRYVRLLNLQGQPIREHAGASRLQMELIYHCIPPGVYLLEVHTPIGKTIIRLINLSKRYGLF